MNVLQREEKRRKLREAVERWPERLKVLASRELRPMTEKDFCAKYGIPATNFNRAKNLHCEPRERRVEQVEKAFEAEGV